jgi:glycosyltransferase involved in cell wall biosynthesis
VPLVSIIIPTYNSAKWIEETIESALSQTYGNFEIIVVDDGSTDETRDIVLSKNHDKVQYVFQQNCGVGSARNKGLSIAKGKYIQFLDADDLIDSNKITLQTALLEANPDFDVAYSDFSYFSDISPRVYTESPKGRKAKYITGDIWEQLLTGNFIVVHAALVRKDAIINAGLFNPEIGCEDYDLWLRISRNGGKFIFSGGILAFYRIVDSSRSSDGIKQLTATIEVVNNVSNYHKVTEREKVLQRKYLASLHNKVDYLKFMQSNKSQGYYGKVRLFIYKLKVKLRKKIRALIRTAYLA